MTERPKRATIRELAEHTNLSPAAVSYALRGLQVSPETQERVQAAAAELGYEADPIARALAGGSTGVVGVLVASLADFWTQELVRALQSEMRAADRYTLIADADGDPARELDLARRLADQRVDGLIVLPIGPTSDGWSAIAGSMPTVSIGDALPGVATAGQVVFDVDRAVEDSLRHLQALGHRRVTVLSGAGTTLPGRPAERAVAEAAVVLGLDCTLVPCASSMVAARPVAAALLAAADRPTALLCLSDSIACGVYDACADAGIAIPGELSVAGFDDHPISRLLAPPLTTTSWHVDEVAIVASDFLRAAIGGGDAEPDRRRAIAPLLHVRASTGPRRGGG